MLVRNWVIRSLDKGELYMVIDQIGEEYILAKLSTGQLFKFKIYIICNEFVFVRFVNGEKEQDTVQENSTEKGMHPLREKQLQQEQANRKTFL